MSACRVWHSPCDGDCEGRRLRAALRARWLWELATLCGGWGGAMPGCPFVLPGVWVAACAFFLFVVQMLFHFEPNLYLVHLTLKA